MAGQKIRIRLKAYDHEVIEIVARIKAILRRTMQDEEDAIIRAGELIMDQDTHEVTVGNEQIELSPTEFKLLRYLMLNPNRVLSKAQILDHVWEYDFNGDAGIVESYISYLRRKVDQFSRSRSSRPSGASATC